MKVNQRVVARYVTLGANIAEPFSTKMGEFDIGQIRIVWTRNKSKILSSPQWWMEQFEQMKKQENKESYIVSSVLVEQVVKSEQGRT